MKNLKILQKRLLLTAIFAANLGLSCIQAQSFYQVIPPKGYWIVETNTKTPIGSIIRFYTEDSKLIYEEYLKKISLDVDRPKTVVLLNAALDEAMINFEISPKSVKNGNIVADLKRRGVDDQLYADRKN